MTYYDLYQKFVRKYNKNDNPNINNDFFSLLFNFSKNIKNSADFYIHRNSNLKLKISTKKFVDYLHQIGEKKVPLALLLNKKRFYGKDLYVRKGSLIPRSETELLVDKIILENFKYHHYKILDLCSGVGNIGLTLAKNLNASVTLVEKHYLPYLCSLKNRRILKINLSKVKIKHMDVKLFLRINHSKFDILVMNPPYIGVNDKKLEENVLKYEPKTALYAKEKGLYFYKFVLNYLPYLMKNKIIVYFEIGQNQEKSLTKIIKNIWWFKIFKVNYTFSNDYHNLTRFLKIIIEEN